MSQARCRYKQACSPFFLTVFVIIGFSAASGSAQTAPETERRINDLLAKMTLQEKVGQLQQLDGDPNTGRVKDEHRDLIRRGLVGSFLNVARGPECQRGAAHGRRRIAAQDPVATGL